MKKKMILILLALLLINVNKVYALCNDEDLKTSIDGVKVMLIEGSNNTLLEDGTVLLNSKEREYAYYLLIDPYVENINVKVTDLGTNKTYDAKYDSNYGTYVYGSSIHFNEKEYLIKIYGNKKSACPNEELVSLNYRVPKYNMNQLSTFCEDHPSDEKCKLDADVTTEEFNEYVEKLEQEEIISKMNFIEKIWFNIKKYYLYVLIPIVVITIGYLVSVRNYKKKVDAR